MRNCGEIFLVESAHQKRSICAFRNLVQISRANKIEKKNKQTAYSLRWHSSQKKNHPRAHYKIILATSLNSSPGRAPLNTLQHSTYPLKYQKPKAQLSAIKRRYQKQQPSSSRTRPDTSRFLMDWTVHYQSVVRQNPFKLKTHTLCAYFRGLSPKCADKNGALLSCRKSFVSPTRNYLIQIVRNFKFAKSLMAFSFFVFAHNSLKVIRTVVSSF